MRTGSPIPSRGGGPLSVRLPLRNPGAKRADVLPDFHDNQIRPHSAIGNLAPAVYARISDPATQRGGARSPQASAATCPVALQGR